MYGVLLKCLKTLGSEYDKHDPNEWLEKMTNSSLASLLADELTLRGFKLIKKDDGTVEPFLAGE
jgi:hypothetical protein